MTIKLSFVISFNIQQPNKIHLKSVSNILLRMLAAMFSLSFRKIRHLFIIVGFMCIPLLTVGQNSQEISVTDFVREIQQWDKRNDKMSLVWWIPKEYWAIALKDNKQVPEEVVQQLETAFENYVLIWACDLKINIDGTMDFTKEDDIRKTIEFTDQKNRKHLPLAKSEVDEQAWTIAENMKPIFAQALGQMGSGLHFYFFRIEDENKQNLITASQPGEFKVSHSSAAFRWNLPLAILLPPKICSIDNEKMKGNWNYCPIHGTNLN